uniref:Uncharacterized protein n=1 Tax=Arundo donax TaxID=35708 RepID=A0A0A8Z266_ARUDO
MTTSKVNLVSSTMCLTIIMYMAHHRCQHNTITQDSIENQHYQN